MIIFHDIRWRNLLSTGNSWTEISLNGSRTTLIVGENGSGKSTLLDALSFALYGRAFRSINKPQLINSTNKKNLEVQVTFNIGVDRYKVIRGLKPNVFEIWKNDQLLNQDAASKDYQLFLEVNILKMNFKSFSQIVVLGSTSFVPFMQLTASSRREIIEDLLDIQIFSVMSNVMKERISTNKDSMSEAKYQLKLITDRIQSANQHNEEIKRLKSIEVDNIKRKVKEKLTAIETIDKRLEDNENEIGRLLSEIVDRDDVKSSLKELQTERTELNLKIRSLKEQISFYDHHDNCPTCKQSIESNHKKSTIHDHNQTAKTVADKLSEVNSKIEDLEKRIVLIEQIENDIHKLNMDCASVRTERGILISNLKEMRKDLDNAKKGVEEVDTKRVQELADDLRVTESTIQQLTVERDLLTVGSSILKDGGIKTRIIKQYIPIINQLINKYLSALEFVVSFELDEQFNETIKSRFRDTFSYQSFSEGEKLRIDLAVLFAWRSVAKIRNSVSTNLCIFDEVIDGAMDDSGTDDFIKIIKNVITDSNVFVISHRTDTVIDKFDSVLRFKKDKEFSSIVTV